MVRGEFYEKSIACIYKYSLTSIHLYRMQLDYISKK